MHSLRNLARVAGAALILTATGAGLLGPTTAAAEVICTTRVQVDQTRGPFSGGTLLSWKLSNTCATPASLKLNGSALAPSGSLVVDPKVTTAYGFSLYKGTTKVSTTTTTVLGGDVVGYRPTTVSGKVSLVPELNPTSAAANAARTIAGDVLEGLGEAARRDLVGKTLEIHVIPAGHPITDAAPWADLADEMTCETTVGGKPNPACVEPRPWPEVRGAGGELIPGSTTRIATPIGAEEIVATTGHPSTHALGHILAHELGHTVLTFAPDSLAEDVLIAYARTRRDAGHDYLGNDGYTRSTVQEFFAEGTAAYFGYEYGSQFENEYTRSWLASNEPHLFPVLSRIYRNG